ncbi:ATP-binding protein [Caulobacter sp. NIBR1757]|uniref:ATP-binding protein n=1 Tax=Caulobacter sp. NIBR1757 TaxID=3016000 RepID=UPI0022F0C75E|nr:ATP-binding protein [Caulobacter sp. NIBR1757]WGM41272.1 Sensor histidine kinase RcsC [Caulobacter sp. NIBR1757]
MPIRLMTAVGVAAGLHLAFGWSWAWTWAALYTAAQGFDHFTGIQLLKRPIDTPFQAARVALITFLPSSIAFGALAPVLWQGIDRYGPALAMIVVATAMTNLIAICRGSRIAFAAGCLPYGLYLLILPLMDAGTAPGPLVSTMMIAVGLVILNVIGAWLTTEEARKISDDARAEAEARRHEAEEATRAKSAWVAMISHELRTPISAILAGAAETERAGHAQGRLINEAGRMMTTLLDDMLDLSKLEAGRMSVEAVDFDLRIAVLDAVRAWRPQARAKGLRMRILGARHLPGWVSGDPTRMRQVINNLLSNALKFTKQGCVTLQLGGAINPDGTYGVTIAVDDTGPGMTPEQLDRLFMPFEQLGAHTARTHGGTGLGLMISRELARLMGGDISVVSAPGKGAVFTLSLTLPAAEAPAAVQAPQAVEARVLVVDDHAVNRQAIALVLAPLGIVPETAGSAEEALERLALESFDAVLMDVYMPDMDGREATRQLRAMKGPNQQVPVIAITASATARDWEACLAAGMTDHVAKPIEPAQLYAALEAALSDVQRAAVAA